MTGARFASFVEDCLPKLRAYARCLCGDAAAADDLVAVAVEQAWERRDDDDFDCDSLLRLMGILREAARKGADLSAAASATDDTSATARAFWRLPRNQRELLMLVCVLEIDRDDAALLLDCAVEELHRGVAEARRALADGE